MRCGMGWPRLPEVNAASAHVPQEGLRCCSRHGSPTTHARLGPPCLLLLLLQRGCFGSGSGWKSH